MTSRMLGGGGGVFSCATELSWLWLLIWWCIPTDVFLTPCVLLTGKNKGSVERFLTQSMNTHTFPWAFTKCALAPLDSGSFELYKQINKQANCLSVQKNSLWCLVCRAVNIWLMNMYVYIYITVAECKQSKRPLLTLFIAVWSTCTNVNQFRHKINTCYTILCCCLSLFFAVWT